MTHLPPPAPETDIADSASCPAVRRAWVTPEMIEASGPAEAEKNLLEEMFFHMS
jgi:hypothetical protein